MTSCYRTFSALVIVLSSHLLPLGGGISESFNFLAIPFELTPSKLHHMPTKLLFVIIRNVSIIYTVIIKGGGVSIMPCLIAARLPIITRSLIVSRSHSAIAPTNVTNSRPIAVEVS